MAEFTELPSGCRKTELRMADPGFPRRRMQTPKVWTAAYYIGHFFHKTA